MNKETEFKKNECIYCNKKVVNPERHWKICLDCFIDKIVETKIIDISLSRVKNKGES